MIFPDADDWRALDIFTGKSKFRALYGANACSGVFFLLVGLVRKKPGLGESRVG